MTEIYIVRHAEAEGNIYRRAHGHYDGYITQNGYRQIEALRHRFSNIPVDVVYMSDLFRTRATAEAIYGGRGIPHIATPALREINLGEWEDLTWGELPRRYPEQYDAWTFHPHDFRVPGSETHEQVYRRFKAELDRIVRENPGRTVAIVSHGAAIRDLLCGLQFGDFTRLCDIGWCDNTAVAKLEADERLNYRVVYQNDNSHLAELSTLGKQKWWRQEDDQMLYNLWFRRAQLPEDLPALCGAYERAWTEIFRRADYRAAGTNAHIRALARSCAGAIAFGMQKQRAAGVIMLDADARIAPEGGHISMLFLEPEFRNRGFGVQFLGYAASVYRALGRKLLTIRVAEHNAHARAFYQKYGFEELGREEDSGARQILMKKAIYFTYPD